MKNFPVFSEDSITIKRLFCCFSMFSIIPAFSDDDSSNGDCSGLAIICDADILRQPIICQNIFLSKPTGETLNHFSAYIVKSSVCAIDSITETSTSSHCFWSLPNWLL